MLLAPHPPPDIVTGNRPVLEDRLWAARPSELFRDPGKLLRGVLAGLEAHLQADERALGPATIDAFSWSATPSGVSGSSCGRTSARR